MVSKPTLYDWLRENKIKSFKIKSRRSFLRADIEAMIRNHETAAVQIKINQQFKKRRYEM